MSFTDLIPLRFRLLALGALAVALLAFGWVKGAQHGEAKLDAYRAAQDAAILELVNKAAQNTARLAAGAAELKEKKDAEVRAINARLAAALERLRERPERRPDLPQVAASCAGVSGAELGRGDGEFLARYAADAAQLAAAVKQCEAQYNQALKALEQ